ncbi:uncharacterized protein N7515_008295 [Penicillium bovifimosum]|uniref:Uncharacterized protein n=1 Tax=Penicillium bovifimosum TaxID=126998 RepID=A0A9W9GPA3_9EURO|nr:uncharacterized protein N7515_008295 [Penicillium bovifimosum]KAJ5124470.1 hypothetical protein N7515_008295 [Penicillium bovifimosum]
MFGEFNDVGMSLREVPAVSKILRCKGLKSFEVVKGSLFLIASLEVVGEFPCKGFGMLATFVLKFFQFTLDVRIPMMRMRDEGQGKLLDLGGYNRGEL